MTKCKVCKAVWSHRAMLHLAVPDKARNSTTLSPPSVHRPVSQHPSLWTTPPICLSSLLLFCEVLPLHKKNIPTFFQKRVKCLHFRIKKFYPFRIKLYGQKLLYCVLLTISISPPRYTTHTSPALLCRLGPLCTFAPPLLHPAICSNGPTHPHPSVLHAIMDHAFETGSRVQLLNEQRRGVFLSDPGPIIVYLCQSLTHWLRTFQQLVVTNRAELWPWYSKKFKFKDFSYLLCRFVKTVTCISYTLSLE